MTNSSVYNGSLRDRVKKILCESNTRILYSVSTKKHIFETFSEFHPEYDVVITPIDELNDKVELIIGSQSVEFTFTWKDMSNPKYPDFKKYHLAKID